LPPRAPEGADRRGRRDDPGLTDRKIGASGPFLKHAKARGNGDEVDERRGCRGQREGFRRRAHPAVDHPAVPHPGPGCGREDEPPDRGGALPCPRGCRGSRRDPGDRDGRGCDGDRNASVGGLPGGRRLVAEPSSGRSSC